MAVTDLTDSLPYWARQSAGAPGATGGPGAAPMGAGGAPGGPDGQAWLQYLAQMYGITPDQAATMMQGGGSPMEMNPHGDGPPGPVSPQAGGMNNFGNPAPVNGPGPGNVGPVPLNAANVQQPPGAPMPARPATGMGMQPGALSSANLGAFNNMPAPSGGGSLNPSAPAAPVGTGPASPVAAPAPVPGPMAGGGAGGQGATSNPRFVGVDRPNADPTARRGSPQMTALNLAGLFGRGQPAANPNAPAANAQPVSAQRPVPGPLANAPMPPVMPPDIWKKRTGLPNY